MLMKRKKITILVPCFNEEKSLPLFYLEINSELGGVNLSMYDWEILFVNDGSKDDTLNIIRKMRASDDRICYVNLSRNFGKENAMLAGFDYATGDAVIIMDADLQDPPSLIPKMIELWEEGYQDIYAKRADRGKESWFRKKCSLLFYRILDYTTRFDILQNVGDFRLLDRRCINALKRLRENERYSKGLFCWIGYRKKEIVFNRGDRVAGKSSWSFWGLLNLAIEGITSFTTAPLRFATVSGIIIAFISFIYGLYFITKTLLFGEPVQGFTTIIVVVLFLGGIQLLAIGILGEYIGKIFTESKNRPVYIASEYNDELI